ncbi:MAG: AAA family ATPase [Arcobacteraceae bacterium]|jgi:flagellar biosynthesis protein FlhG|nr:AAA family ATPase [Arcobacteraceae bacterium]
MFDTISTQAAQLIHLTNEYKLNSKKSSKTKVIAITSGKGGVGKSTISANMAYLLALYGKKVLVFDADIGLANMQILFNVKPNASFYDYIERGLTLDEVILDTPYKNISLCAGKSGYQYGQNKSSFVYSRIIKDIVALDTYDVILLDTGAGLNEYVQEFLEVSDEIIAVTTTDPSALTDVYALIKMLSQTKEKLFLLFNQTPNYKIGETITKSLKDLATKNKLNKLFMVKYIGNISVDLNIATTGRLRKLFVKEFDSSASSFDLNNIVNSLVKEIS